MSKLLEMTAEIVTNEETGKRRILTTLYRDENLELRFILPANDAEQWAAKMLYLAAQFRKEQPDPVQYSIKILRSMWKRLLNMN
jgi:hypothetical protein